MSYNYYIVDVFTDQVFNGAQVAVIPNASKLSDQSMLKIAQELNLTETVFLQSTSELHRWKMRTFSPFGEIDFSGHPILAAAFVLANSGAIKLTESELSLSFQQNISTISVNLTLSEGKAEFIQYSLQTSSIVDSYAPTDSEMAAFLNIKETCIDSKKYSARLVSCGFPYLIVPVFNYESLRSAHFNFSAWSQSIAPQTAAQEILLFAPKTPNPDSDFAVRLFGPKIGMHEDPPVGTAMPALASYLCSFDHLQKGTYTFAVERGEQSVRRSLLNLEMDHKGEDLLTLRVGGNAVMVAEGMINIPVG